MTYSPTHFAMAGLLVWATMGEEKRKEFAERKKGHFLLLNFVAVLPDFDFIFLIHRGASHSLIGPVMLLIIGICMRKVLVEKSDEHAFYADLIILAAIFWQLAVILDLGMGPIAIFWPISEKYYDFTFAVETSIKPLGFLPFTVSGLIMGVERLSPSEGRLSYIYNWSTEERIARFGPEPVRWNVPDLFLHILIFLVWIVAVGRKLVPAKITNWLKIRKDGAWLPLLRNRLSILAVFLMFLSLVMGPMQGPIQIESEEQIEANLVIGPTSFSPGIWLDPNLEETARGSAIVEIGNIGSGKLGLVEISRNEVLEFVTTLFNAWNQSRNVSQSISNSTFNSQSVSMSSDFPTNYSSLIEHIRNRTKLLASSVNTVDLGPLKLDSEDSIALVYVHTWDLYSFQDGPWEIRLGVKAKWDRTAEYVMAALIGLAGTSLLVIPTFAHLGRN